MQNLSVWENLFLGIIALLILFSARPGIKAAMERSKQTPADWPAVLWPLLFVLLFVLLLIKAV